VAVSAANCVFLEWLWNKLMKKPNTIADLSAVVTGVLLAFNVPASMPIWQLFVGDFIAIIIVKMLFGGIGCNFINPALVGRVSMMLSFTSSMTNYSGGVDTISSATPLATMAELRMGDFMTLFLGRHGCVLGETCALALLIGLVYLLVRGVIKITIPAAFIGSVFVFTLLFTGFNATQAVLSLFSGGLLLGAIFMATDYVTSPLTAKGQLIFGVGCGLLTVFIRRFGSFPEGVCYSILLMNCMAWIIDQHVKPVRFGVDPAAEKAKEAAKK
jgi:electron transport complex protein RnfD